MPQDRIASFGSLYRLCLRYRMSELLKKAILILNWRGPLRTTRLETEQHAGVGGGPVRRGGYPSPASCWTSTPERRNRAHA